LLVRSANTNHGKALNEKSPTSTNKAAKPPVLINGIKDHQKPTLLGSGELAPRFLNFYGFILCNLRNWLFLKINPIFAVQTKS